MRLIFCIFSLLLTSCASTPSDAAKRIQETDEAHVTGCKDLGHVSGGSPLGGVVFAEVGKDDARTAALDKAAELGATHIVWSTLTGGFLGGLARGRAYACTK